MRQSFTLLVEWLESTEGCRHWGSNLKLDGLGGPSRTWTRQSRGHTISLGRTAVRKSGMYKDYEEHDMLEVYKQGLLSRFRQF